MKNIVSILMLAIVFLNVPNRTSAQSKPLKLVFIRHGERPNDGDNLNCQGLNRSLQLPAVLYNKFGKADNIYVPALNLGKTTKRGRMLQTISPYAIKYGISINSKYDEEDYNNISAALLAESGTVIIVWEHNTIIPILKLLGVKKTKLMDWPDSDFDTIWVITFAGGKAELSRDQEGLKPAVNCPF